MATPTQTSFPYALRRVADVRAIFAPEHGQHGVAGAGEHVGAGTHRSGVPIHSLYGHNFAPTKEQLEAGRPRRTYAGQTDVGQVLLTFVVPNGGRSRSP